MTPLRLRTINDMQIRNCHRTRRNPICCRFRSSPAILRSRRLCLGRKMSAPTKSILTNEKKLAPKSIHVTVSALRFLYRVTLGFEWDFDLIIPCPKVPKTLAVILSPEEVLHFLGCVESLKHQVILTTCYAAGLRISEAVRLKPGAIDRQRMVLRVDQGKGRRNRYVMSLGPVAGDTDRLLARRPAEHVDVPGGIPQ